jgi:hypothetical protein
MEDAEDEGEEEQTEHGTEAARAPPVCDMGRRDSLDWV